MAIPNPITALVTFLKADAEVTTQVGTKVFGAELPASETANMPQKCLVIAATGGPGGGFGGSRMRVNRIRLDIKGYGTTPATAWDVYHSAYDALKQLNGSVQSTVYLMTATVSSGPIQLRDADLDWPLVMGSFEVTAAEVAVA